MVKLMAGVLAIFASLSMSSGWEQKTTKKTYEWHDSSVVSYEELQRTQNCYTWVSLGEEKQEALKQDKK